MMTNNLVFVVQLIVLYHTMVSNVVFFKMACQSYFESNSGTAWPVLYVAE